HHPHGENAVPHPHPNTRGAAHAAPPVPKRAYEKIPATPLAPPSKPPLETRVPVAVPSEPLGPPSKWMGVPVPENSPQKGGGISAETDVDRSQTNPFFYGPPSPRQPAN